MAEALGLVSGVIAVVDMATKVGGASIKLKRLWDEVNEVPSVLLQKAELVQEWDELFNEAERQLAVQTLPALVRNKALLQKFTTKARSVLAELQLMIDGLLEQSTVGRRYKRKIGSTKVVLRKSDIKALDEKLDEALTQFQMAQSLYTMSTLMYNPILAIENQSTHSPGSDKNQNISDSPIAHSDSGDNSTADEVIYTISEPDVNFSVSASRTMAGRARFTFGSRGGFQFSLRTPDWLSSSVYFAMASKSIKGWDFHLRAYEVVPSFRTTGLIDHFKNDDALAIFRFLDENKMTPFVRDMDGQGLLHLACQYAAVNFMILLQKRGTRLSVAAKDTQYWGNYIPPYWFWGLLLEGFEAYPSLCRNSPFPGQNMLQLLRSHDIDEEAFNYPGAFAHGGGLPANVQSNLMGNEYYSIPVKTRLRDARWAWTFIGYDFESFLFWLPELKHDPCGMLRASREPETHSFIHTIAKHLPFAIDELPHNHHLPITSHPWFGSFCKYIAADPEGVFYVEACYEGGQTPFSMMINETTRRIPRNIIHAERIQEPTQLWITALLSCGIDLLNYGRMEQALYRRQDVAYNHQETIPEGDFRSWVYYTLIGITYGPRPEYWKLWWAFEYEEFAGDFWRIVEQPSAENLELNIPGTWVEEPMDLEEWDKYDKWRREERPPLIWSEYRKIRPPM